MVFRSAVDTWFYLVVVATAAIVLAASLPVVGDGNVAAVLTVFVAALLAIGLPLWLLLSTVYTVTRDELVVKSGPFTWRIARSEIRQIRPSRSILSSPALSLDRLEIRYGTGKSILVSPVDKNAFIAALGFDV